MPPNKTNVKQDQEVPTSENDKLGPLILYEETY